jgi:hypothetical protein
MLLLNVPVCLAECFAWWETVTTTPASDHEYLLSCTNVNSQKQQSKPLAFLL